MSEAMSDALSSIREHAPSIPSAKDAKEALRSHLPSVDASAIADRLPKPRSKRKVIAALIGALAGVAAVASYLRRRNDAPAASLYTPPLPKP
ncbi:MAG TPA: hypothetical protein VG650_09660 [Mycobacteriales bacterium]|nr:hypothetical protein [Mycobacteriales bacterium]